MSFFTPTNPSYDQKWEEYTLVMPAVCVGNVGQLSVDVLISTTLAERIGHIYDDSLLPVIGNDPYTTTDTNSCRLSTCCDVYCADIERLVIIQQRALFVKGKRKSYREKLVKWMKEKRFARVVLLSGSFAHARSDNQLTGTQFRYLAATQELRDLITTGHKKWCEMEDGEDEMGRKDLQIPGGGITKTLYRQSCEEDIPLIVLLKFCSEGDNALDALRLINFANGLLGVFNELPRETMDELVEVWKIPKSWSLNFGSTFSQVIYS